jgi:selenocysteine-specific elongation factor
MHVIGTAGHVDHGKSSLVEALTGIDPDRLKEEQQRQMTIDLGFAWLKLPSGQEVGIVDVPGHRDFIENMLAGMAGIELALLVIAMDEGVMPQTREHLSVLSLLEVKTGIIVLTKSDLVQDEEWLRLVRDDVKKLVMGTVFERAPLVSVSARNGEGIPELIRTIDDQVRDLPEKPDLSLPRLSVDRIFSLTGFGTIVTGTLLDGGFSVGDEIEVLPSHFRSRIRGLQNYKQKVEIALPGSRTAVNLSGLKVDQLSRGDVLIKPGTYQSSNILEVKCQMLANASVALQHGDEVKVFIGTAEINAHARLLEGNAIEPGGVGFLQIDLSHSVMAVKGDRLILRRPSPPETIAGGEVLDTHPKRLRKRSSRQMIDHLQFLKTGFYTNPILQLLQRAGFQNVHLLVSNSRMSMDETKSEIDQLIGTGRVIRIPVGRENDLQNDDLIIDIRKFNEIIEIIRSNLVDYCQVNPLRLGMKKEELRSNLSFSKKEFESFLLVLKENGTFLMQGNLVCLPDRKLHYSATQEKMVEVLLNRFDASPHETPTIGECVQQVGVDVFQSLLDQQVLIQISPEVVFRAEVLDEMEEEIKISLANEETITLGQVRDLLKTSRKYALAVLEHLDRSGVTIREGDHRRIKNI